MMDGPVAVALVIAVIKHGGARIAAAVLLVLLGMLMGKDANSRPQDREIHKMQPAQHQTTSGVPQPARGAFSPEEIKAFVVSQINRATLPLEEGTAVLEIPSSISKRSHNALKLWLELMLKLAEVDSPSIPSS